MKHTGTTLTGLVIQRKATGEIFTITGKEGSFFLLNGGADNGGRDVMGSELCYYTRVQDSPTPCLCNGTGWLEAEGNHWTKALFQDVRQAFAYRALNRSYKPCGCGVNLQLAA